MDTRPTIPYFYIIKHKPSGKLYAGCRYAKGCHPDELLQPKGYQTSSNVIKNLIKQEGLDSFEILRIDTCCDGLEPKQYETLFLEINNCAKSKNWYNCHNNNGNNKKISECYKEKTGYSNPSQNKEIIEKKKKNYIEKTGYSCPLKNPTVKEKIKNTCLEKYGCETPNENREIRKRTEKTNLEKYGVECVLAALDVREKVKIKNLEKYGCENPLGNLEIRKRTEKTNLEKYGVKNIGNNKEYMMSKLKEYQQKTGLSSWNNCPKAKEKKRNNYYEKTGYYYQSQNPAVKEKMKKTKLLKFLLKLSESWVRKSIEEGF